MEYRYAGPDGGGIASLPQGVGGVLGSEYCVHLLPSPERLRDLLEVADARSIPLVLLTPWFRDAELKRAVRLIRGIPEGADIDVAVNDWGALHAFHILFPRLRLSIGRLLSGQKRCPRIGSSSFLTHEGRSWHGEGLFSSARARKSLRESFGVHGYHVDSLAWGPDPREMAMFDDADDAPVLYVHGPHAIVTVSDYCPWIGGKSGSALESCPRYCRDGAVSLREPSMGMEILQRGKARFVRSEQGAGKGSGDSMHRTVLYGELP